MTVTSALSALLGALEGHDLAPEIHEAIADANAALMRDADAVAHPLRRKRPTTEWLSKAAEMATALDAANSEIARLREQVAEELRTNADLTDELTSCPILEVQAEVEQLREQVRQVESAFRTVDSELSSSQREAAELREQVTERDERLAQVRRALTSWQLTSTRDHILDLVLGHARGDS
jgi:uncharacterized coiled-coil DUF342 family protein